MDEKPTESRHERRVIHKAEAGGCGEDITEFCHWVTLRFPTVQVDNLGNLQNAIVETGVTSAPMVCPKCGKGTVFQEPRSPIQVARTIP